MEKKATSKSKSNILLKVVSCILILFTILCIIIIFKDRNYNLILSVVGIIFLVSTINIANRLPINRQNIKTISKASIIINIISIPLLFNYVIFSYALVIPSFMLNLKCKKITNESSISKSYIFSLVMLIACILASIIRYIIILNS